MMRRRTINTLLIGVRISASPKLDVGRDALTQRSASGVRRGKAALSSGCKPHPANSLPPEAIGAVMEVTKWLKPSISVSRIGDSASEQAAT
jgi:hypothetical protein